MKPTFLSDRPLLTVMIHEETPEDAIRVIRNANCLGADAYGLSACFLNPEYQNEEVYQRLYKEMRGKPVYVTNYRGMKNAGKTDEELAEGLKVMVQSGGTLPDVLGDLYCRHPEEMTDDPEAIARQMALIDELHGMGAEVLMSAHLHKFVPAERILEIAFEQRRRGADVVKIVSHANDMAEEIENLRITDLLKRELGGPFLFLSGGECSIHRRLGLKLGCCMSLCVYEHDVFSASLQPLLTTMKTIRDGIDF